MNLVSSSTLQVSLLCRSVSSYYKIKENQWAWGVCQTHINMSYAVLVKKVNKERKHISGKKQFYIIKSNLTWDKIAGLFQNEKEECTPRKLKHITKVTKDKSKMFHVSGVNVIKILQVKIRVTDIKLKSAFCWKKIKFAQGLIVVTFTRIDLKNKDFSFFSR